MELLYPQYSNPDRLVQWLSDARKRSEVKNNLREFAKDTAEAQQEMLTTMRDFRNAMRAVCEQRGVTLEKYHQQTDRLLHRYEGAVLSVLEEHPHTRKPVTAEARYMMQSAGMGGAGLLHQRISRQDLAILGSQLIQYETERTRNKEHDEVEDEFPTDLPPPSGVPNNVIISSDSIRKALRKGS